LTERLKYILDDSGETLDGITTSSLSNLISKTELSKLYVSHLSIKTAGTTTDALTTGLAGVSPVLQYSVKATIMFKDIHPLIEVMPISKSLNFKIQIFWNNSVATASHDGTNWTNQTSQFRAYNGTLPLMLNNVAEGFDGATAGTVRASVYVGDTCYDTTQRTAGVLATGGVGKQVELHVQAVQMLPDIESNYAQNHLRDVSYHDYYQFSLKNIASGESFNHLVSNGISNLKAVLIVPLQATRNNNVNIFDDGLPQLMGHMNNFNVLVGGSNILHADARYTYQSFNNELYNDFGVNGNQSSGMGSSLIDFKSWLKKPYYYVNCSRVPMEQKNAYRYLQIKGTNSSALAMDYMIFAVYKKNFQLDVMSGNINKIE